MFKPPNAVFVEMCLSLRALVQETCIQKEMIFADFFTEFSFKLNSKDHSCGCMRMFLHSYKWTDFFWIPHDLDSHFPRKLPTYVV
jgi:hypothetical protein